MCVERRHRNNADVIGVQNSKIANFPLQNYFLKDVSKRFDEKVHEFLKKHF
jgi:hypothetical protein